MEINISESRKSLDAVAFLKDNPKLCLYPFSGLVVNPDGRISPCCHNPSKTLTHINDVDNLNYYFNEITYEEMRYSFQELKKIPKTTCSVCADRFPKSHPYKLRNPLLPYDTNNFSKNKKIIRYLEYTPSNLCNQACAMCGSPYSSKWESIDKIALENNQIQFRYENEKNHRTRLSNNLKLSDKNFNKIVECVEEGVSYLYIKGGEPFADERNIDLLERIVYEKFPYLEKVGISTNLKRMDKRVVNLFKRLYNKFGSNFHPSVSIDGIDKQYHWIRSSTWERLVDNTNKLYSEVPNFKYNCSVTLTIYNYFNLCEIFDGISKLKNVNSITGRLATNPRYLCPSFVVPKNIRNKYTLLHKENIVGNKKYHKKRKNDWICIDPPHLTIAGKCNLEKEYEEGRKELKEFTDFMNKIRGFNIQDVSPKFGEFYESL